MDEELEKMRKELLKKYTAKLLDLPHREKQEEMLKLIGDNFIHRYDIIKALFANVDYGRLTIDQFGKIFVDLGNLEKRLLRHQKQEDDVL